jgi:hypothetical protein
MEIFYSFDQKDNIVSIDAFKNFIVIKSEGLFDIVVKTSVSTLISGLKKKSVGYDYLFVIMKDGKVDRNESE